MITAILLYLCIIVIIAGISLLWIGLGIYWMIKIPLKWCNYEHNWSLQNIPNVLLLTVFVIIASIVGFYIGPFAYIPYAISRDTKKKTL